jgi:small subunit ribosomal protein S18
MAEEAKEENRVSEVSDPKVNKEEEARPESRPETRPEAKPEARPESRAETRPESRAETRPEAKPEARPGARPGARPTEDRRRGSVRSSNGPFQQRRGYFRKKVCKLCVRKIKDVDYKDVDMLRRFVTDRGKILPRRITGTCAKHQRVLATAIKRARFVALLPFEANK